LGAIFSGYAQPQEPYNLSAKLDSRSISFENPTGEPGSGGKAINEQLGAGRKVHHSSIFSQVKLLYYVILSKPVLSGISG
jgi:hypothetical protein